MNFLAQLGVLVIILVILVILIKSNQTLEKIYMEEEDNSQVEIELPKIKLSEVKIPKWKRSKKEKSDAQPEETIVERSSGTMPVDTSAKWSVEVLDDRGRVTESHKMYAFPFHIG